MGLRVSLSSEWMRQTVLRSNFGSLEKNASKIAGKEDILPKEPPFL